MGISTLRRLTVKNLSKLSGIVAVIAAIALFSMASCKDPTKPDVTFTVTFNTNGGDGTPPPEETVQAGSSIILPRESGLSRSGGYAFGGWNTDPSGAGTNYSGGSSYTVTGNITLYAKWNAVQPTTVTFDANGGSGTAPSAQTVSSGSSITLPDGSGLSRSGYIFGGWNANADGTGTNYSGGSSYTVTGNITLYAKWVVLGSGGTHEEVTIAMWDNAGDGWDGNAALRINVNGTDHANARLDRGRGPDYYRFDVETGDVVQIYWVSGGRYDGEIAFAVYYNDDLPNPAFNPSTGTTDSARVLLSKLYDNPSGAVGNGTLMGSFTVGSYIVTFNSNGGSGTVPTAQTVTAGSSITLPSGSGLTKTGYAFGGWNTNSSGTGTNYDGDSPYTVTNNFTLYAKWDTVPLESFTSLADQLGWLQIHAESDTSYTLKVYADESINPQTLSYSGRSNITITLQGVGANRTINGGLTVGSVVTLVLDSDITLRSSVSVTSGGTLIMNTGSVLSAGNTRIGGVYVNGGTFTMNDGTISGNTITRPDGGGGVYVDRGTFIMNGGEISGNTADYYYNSNLAGSKSYYAHGGGVYVSAIGDFTMNGGVISGNTASNSDGGGVYVSGIFTMGGGTISGNTARSGGGVYVNRVNNSYPIRGTFIMSGVTISGNTARNGGGVYVSGTFDGDGMSARGIFTMYGGTISGNTANVSGSSYNYGYGGGVYLIGGRERTEVGLYFDKTGGIIYGYSESDTVNSNVVKDSSGNVLSERGHAIYVRMVGIGSEGSVDARRETTAGPEIILSCNKPRGAFGDWQFSFE
jgi:uncharacterized repeat protein (TIGR02543 family)